MYIDPFSVTCRLQSILTYGIKVLVLKFSSILVQMGNFLLYINGIFSLAKELWTKYSEVFYISSTFTYFSTLHKWNCDKITKLRLQDQILC